MTLSAIHNLMVLRSSLGVVVCDIGGYDFVSYSQPPSWQACEDKVVCDIGGYDFVSYSQQDGERLGGRACCL